MGLSQDLVCQMCNAGGVDDAAQVELDAPGLESIQRAGAVTQHHRHQTDDELVQQAGPQALLLHDRRSHEGRVLTRSGGLTQLARDHYADRLISRAEFLAARQVIEARIEATHRALSERPRTGILLDVPSTEAALRAAWETWTVDRRHAVVASVLPAVVVGPARRGKRFDADRVELIWRV
jgi:hypothetical protein